MKLLTSNTKIEKSTTAFPDYEATILQMLPGKGVCVNYKDCLSDCLAFTGFAKIFGSVNKSRKAKKDYFLKDYENFMIQLIKEVKNQEKRANKKGKRAVIRLNGFTDIDWSKCIKRYGDLNIFQLFPSVIFYDYSADYNKVQTNRQANYHLTFSYKGNNMDECINLLKIGVNIAVIDTPENRDTWFNKMPAIQGDAHDFRFLDSDASIVWLSFKK